MEFRNLPNDILIQIYNALDFKSIIHLSLANKRLYDCFQLTPVQYKYWLERTNQIDIDVNNKQSIEIKLNKIKSVDRNFNNFHPQQHHIIVCDEESALKANVNLNFVPDIDISNCKELIKDGHYILYNQDRLIVYELPLPSYTTGSKDTSQVRPLLPKVIDVISTLNDVSFKTHGVMSFFKKPIYGELCYIDIDIENDVLCCSFSTEYDIFLRFFSLADSIKNNKCVEYPAVNMIHSPCPYENGGEVSLIGKYVILKYYAQGGSLFPDFYNFVWDWKSGLMKSFYIYPGFIPYSMEFLTPDILILSLCEALCSNMKLTLFQIDHDQGPKEIKNCLDSFLYRRQSNLPVFSGFRELSKFEVSKIPCIMKLHSTIPRSRNKNDVILPNTNSSSLGLNYCYFFRSREYSLKFAIVVRKSALIEKAFQEKDYKLSDGWASNNVTIIPHPNESNFIYNNRYVTTPVTNKTSDLNPFIEVGDCNSHFDAIKYKDIYPQNEETFKTLSKLRRFWLRGRYYTDGTNSLMSENIKSIIERIQNEELYIDPDQIPDFPDIPRTTAEWYASPSDIIETPPLDYDIWTMKLREPSNSIRDLYNDLKEVAKLKTNGHEPTHRLKQLHPDMFERIDGSGYDEWGYEEYANLFDELLKDHSQSFDNNTMSIEHTSNQLLGNDDTSVLFRRPYRSLIHHNKDNVDSVSIERENLIYKSGKLTYVYTF